MNNVTLLMLSEFIVGNYENLKEYYNKLSKEDKKQVPITLFIIRVFDTLLTAQIKENESKKSIIVTPDSLAQMEAKNNASVQGLQVHARVL